MKTIKGFDYHSCRVWAKLTPIPFHAKSVTEDFIASSVNNMKKVLLYNNATT